MEDRGESLVPRAGEPVKHHLRAATRLPRRAEDQKSRVLGEARFGTTPWPKDANLQRLLPIRTDRSAMVALDWNSLAELTPASNDARPFSRTLTCIVTALQCRL